MLKISKTELNFQNQIPKTRVHIDVTNDDGNRIDGVIETFREGQEIAQAEWIASKSQVLREQYPAETITKNELLAKIAELQKK
jgi:hypothetical protein